MLQTFFMILGLVALMSRQVNVPETTLNIKELQHTQSSSGSGSNSGSSSNVYHIVVDAGSTGSRVHIFTFERSGKSLQLISDNFKQLKPGLSSYSDQPQKAAESLEPLMQEAFKSVPADLQVNSGTLHADMQHCGLTPHTSMQLRSLFQLLVAACPRAALFCTAWPLVHLPGLALLMPLVW